MDFQSGFIQCPIGDHSTLKQESPLEWNMVKTPGPPPPKQFYSVAQRHLADQVTPQVSRRHNHDSQN